MQEILRRPVLLIRRGLMSSNTRKIIALVVVLLGSTFGGLLAVALTDSRLAAIAGVVLGAVVGMLHVVPKPRLAR